MSENLEQVVKEVRKRMENAPEHFESPEKPLFSTRQLIEKLCSNVQFNLELNEMRMLPVNDDWADSLIKDTDDKESNDAYTEWDIGSGLHLRHTPGYEDFEKWLLYHSQGFMVGNPNRGDVMDMLRIYGSVE